MMFEMRLLILAVTCSVTTVAAAAAQIAGGGEAAPGTLDNPGQSAASSLQSATGLQEIVVTAQRRSENLQNVPITVTAVSGAQLAARGVENTQDLANVVPGLTFPSNQGTALPHLRGVGTTVIGAGIESSVALYVDGVYYATPAGSILALNNVAQIEVLKGPQGTLFGRNATGGLIQITTRDPSQTPHANFSYDYGNYNTNSVGGYITGGVTNNIAADLAVQYSKQGDGFGTNLANGQPVYRNEFNLSVRSKIFWEPTTSTSARLSLDFESSRSSQGFAEVPGTASSNIFYANRPDLITLPLYDVNTNLQPVQRSEGGGASLRITQQLGFGQLTSITAYRKQRFYFTVDPDLGPTPFLDVISDQTDEQISQEFQLQSTQSGKFRWTAGLFYFHATDGLYPQLAFFSGIASPHVGQGLSLTEQIVTATETTNSVAGYGQAAYEVLPLTNVTIGARLTYEKKALSGSSTGQINNAFLVPFGPNSGHFGVTKPSWRVSVDHRFADDFLGYVSYNRGFKSGGYNVGLPSEPPYRTELLDAYEVGTKTQFLDRRLRVNLSGFLYNYDNIQVVRYRNGVAEAYNGASAKIYGLDLDVDAAVTRSLTLSGGLEALHSEFTSFPCANYYAGGPHLNSAACSAITTPTLPYQRTAAGNAVPYAPVLTATVAADYRFSLGTGTMDLNVNDSYNGGYYSEPDNNLRQGSYHVINASLRWDSSRERLFVRLWTKNLGDAHYTVQLSSSADEFAETFAPPRTFGVTVGANF